MQAFGGSPRPLKDAVLLAAIGLCAHVAAFGRAFTLRSGCDLRPTTTKFRWLGEAGDLDIDALTIDEAVALVDGCASAAERAGLPVGSKWAAPVTLTPQKRLADVIRKSWPETEPPKPDLGM